MSYSKTVQVGESFWGSRSTVIDVNSIKSILAILLIGVIGPCMFIVQPAYVQGLVEYMSYTDEQAGLITSAEMFGVALTAITSNFVFNRFNWRIQLIVFLVIASLGNVFSLMMQDASSLMIMRFITGLGSGGVMVFSFTMMGITRRSDRNLGYMLVAILSYGAIGLLVMPTALSWVGMEGILIFFSVFCFSGLFFIKYLPCSHQAHEVSEEKTKYYSLLTKFLTLCGVLVYNVAIGLVWVYMFLLGVEAGIPEQTVANGLTVSQFCGVLGAFMAVLFESRYGRQLPLTIGILGGGAGIWLLIGSPPALAFIIGVCIFNGLWNLTVPYLMAFLADFDSKGQVVNTGVSLQFVGYAIGPALAAALFETGGYDLINGIAIVLFILSMLLLYPGLRKQSLIK
jgi:MFS family permease